jgi:hypothetical protein
LPTSICIECRNTLLIFHDFRNKCRSNETTFMEAVRILEGGEEPNTGNKEDSARLDIEEMVDHSFNAPTDFYLELNSKDSRKDCMLSIERDERRATTKTTQRRRQSRRKVKYC